MYNFYFQQADSGLKKNLEVDFEGAKYVSCEGLNVYGELKSVYSESFADSEETSVYIGEKRINAPNDIKFDILFTGENKQKVYDAFYDFVSKEKMVYWDDARNKKAYIYLKDIVEPTDDMVKSQYIRVEFTFGTYRPTEAITNE